MSRRFPDWEHEGRDWPNREASMFVDADGYHWHVQRMGDGSAPVCLLIHGTGAATHSWRDLMPLLAKDWHVVAMDLPGHGFTRSTSSRPVGLAGMTRSVEALLGALDVTPDVVVGHSAGAAIGVKLLLERGVRTPLIGLNPALLPFPGLAAKLFPQLAKMLFTNPLTARIFARIAMFPGETERFLSRSTGSRIDRIGLRHYRALLGCHGHCDGALRMMANWQLESLQTELPSLRSPTLFLHGERDRAIPRTAVEDAAALIPDARVEILSGVGHLAHEERPELVADLLVSFAATTKGGGRG